MSIGKIRAFLAEETGATAIEYGLLAALIAVAIIGTFTVLGNSLEDLFNNGATAALDAANTK
ncbi:MAG: Flp family type IVb pilin [Devosia sp.]|jgi:pilus assembly protein Flp/PilA